MSNRNATLTAEEAVELGKELKKAINWEALNEEAEIEKVFAKHGVYAKFSFGSKALQLKGGISDDSGRLAYIAKCHGFNRVSFSMVLTERLFEFPEIESLQREIAEVKNCLDDLEEINSDLVNA